MTDEEQKQNGMPETTNQGTISPGDQGIGAFLREEREKSGLSYRAVAEHTRLRPRFLEALEKEQWEVLPPPAFLRGFLRTYARLLSLNERTVLDLYDRAVPAKDGALSPRLEKPGGGKKRRVLLVLCMLIAVAALVFAWKEYVSQYDGSGSELKERPAAESRKVEIEVLPDERTPPLRETPRAEIATPQGVPARPPEDSQLQASLSIPAGEERGAAQAAADRSHPGEHILRASVNARTWLRIRIDDFEPREYMLQPGSRPEWKARQGFYLFIGNAGGIDLTFDGERVARLGGPGQVVHLRLPGDFPRARGEE